MQIWKLLSQDGRCLKENVLFQSNPNALQICLYHNYFNIVNPLGNKTKLQGICILFCHR